MKGEGQESVLKWGLSDFVCIPAAVPVKSKYRAPPFQQKNKKSTFSRLQVLSMLSHFISPLPKPNRHFMAKGGRAFTNSTSFTKGTAQRQQHQGQGREQPCRRHQRCCWRSGAWRRSRKPRQWRLQWHSRGGRSRSRRRRRGRSRARSGKR